jgi:Calcineurin-like phosphoesterase
MRRSGRVAVIGDVGGQASELHRALAGLGADDETLELSSDLMVIQLGDLVHRGPDSAGGSWAPLVLHDAAVLDGTPEAPAARRMTAP